MKRQLFQDLVVSQAGGGGSRTQGLPYSLGLHGLALGAVVVAPLLGQNPLPLPEPEILKGPVVFEVRPPAGGGGLAARPAMPGRSTLTRLARPSLVAPSEIPPPELVEPAGPEETPLVGVCLGSECLGGGGEGLREGPGEGSGTSIGEAPPRVVRVDVDVQAPTKIHDVAPVYPELARRVGVQGVVIIECTIAPNGRVANARVLKGQPLLDQAALDAVKQWVYVPTRVNGAPVAVLMTVTVRFHLRS